MVYRYLVLAQLYYDHFNYDHPCVVPSQPAHPHKTIAPATLAVLADGTCSATMWMSLQQAATCLRANILCLNS